MVERRYPLQPEDIFGTLVSQYVMNATVSGVGIEGKLGERFTTAELGWAIMVAASQPDGRKDATGAEVIRYMVQSQDPASERDDFDRLLVKTFTERLMSSEEAVNG